MKNKVWPMLSVYFGGALLVATGAACQFGIGYGLIVLGTACIAEVLIP